MPFVKLDTGILESTLWIDPVARDIFITALLMAEPFELTEPTKQIEVTSLNYTGFTIPPGWYGFIHAAGVGIVRRALMDPEKGLKALAELGAADLQSRTSEFEGRRLVRVDGGFIVLNFFKYRDKDYTAAERMKRLRERRKLQAVTPNVTNVTRNSDVADSRVQSTDKDFSLVPSGNGHKPSKKKQAPDPRHTPCRERLFEFYRTMNEKEPPWGPGDAGQLAKLLKECPKLTVPEFDKLLENYSHSDGLNFANRPAQFLPRLVSFANGPLNKYGRPKTDE